MKKDFCVKLCSALFVSVLALFCVMPAAFASETASSEEESSVQEPTTLPETTSLQETTTQPEETTLPEETTTSPEIPLQPLVFRYMCDVNNDGEILPDDARLILRTSVGIDTLSGENALYADADLNGQIEPADARTALRVSVGLDDKMSHAFVCETESEPDCTETGLLTYHCPDCLADGTTVLPRLLHSYAMTSENLPGCVEDGERIFECSECGNSYKEKLPANGHKLTEKVAAAVSCTTDGKIVYSCSECSYSETVTEKAKGHTWQAATATAPKKCTSCGIMETGWTNVDGKYYYFNEKGILLKNCIVGSYYVDKSGVRTDDEAVNLAVAYVNAHSSASASNADRLKACFNYLAKNYSYVTIRGIPTASEIRAGAISMFKNKSGNCYRYASAFAYIALVLGYDSRIEEGTVKSASGYMSAHGWTEVKVGDVWYMCDAIKQKQYSSSNLYMRTDSNYPLVHAAGTVITLTVDNGVPTWK